MAVYIPVVGLRSLLTALSLLFFAATVSFLVKLYTYRRKFVEMQRLGLPMPPHSLLFGHILVFAKVGSTMPTDCHGHNYARMIRQAYPDLPPNFYIDLWPVGEQMLIVADPTIAVQCTQERSLPKFPGLKTYMTPLTGDKDLLTMEGKEWKVWRSIYNPGFSAGHLMTMVPGIVEDTQTFCEVLKSYAKAGGIFKLEEVLTRLTVDIIGRVVLDTRMNAQKSENELLAGFRSQVKWLATGDEINPFKKYQPLRPFVYWYNTRRMNRWLSRELDERFSSRKELSTLTKMKRSKPVVDLALDAYLAENHQDAENVTGIDATFKEFAVNQIKLFIFAGHDTTSSTLAYMCYLLWYNPAVLAKLMAELDSVFGKDHLKTAAAIVANPHILNRLSYTTAVMKETLRLFPPASTLRAGQPDFTLNVYGTQFPTNDMTVWVVHQAMHRDPTLWPEPETFNPERWLVPEGDHLYPVKGAWRPFEFGPRNCIGQELAMLEMKIIMALVIREFEVEPVYGLFDRIRGVKRKTLDGERAYQILSGSAKPVDNMPAKVRMRTR